MKTQFTTNQQNVRNPGRREALTEFMRAENAKRTPERLFENQMLGIKYTIELYVNDLLMDADGDGSNDYISLHDFVKQYLKLLNISQKQLAELFEMKDSNLHKYLTGERKLNTDIAFKLASFTKTTPEHWLRLEIRNELKKLGAEKAAEFEKYGYEHVVNAQD